MGAPLVAPLAVALAPFCFISMPLPDPLLPPRSLSFAHSVWLWLQRFWPAPVGITVREGLRMAIGMACGMLLVAWLGHGWGALTGLQGPWLLASLGASAVLVFGMPSSPLSQPWPVLAGSLLSMWVGVASAVLVPDGAWAGALAVAVSVAVMLPLRCLHPPGAALALSMVLNPQQAAQLHGWTVPVTLLALLAVGMLYNNLTGRRYPHAQSAPEVAPRGPGAFTSADLDAALSHYNGVLDVSRADLEGLLHLAGRAAFARTLGDLRCEDIMSQPALSVEAAVSLKDAQALMRSERVKALPVVDDQRQVCGIVTVADFMHLARTDAPEGLGQRLRSLVRGRSTQPTLVGQIMSQPVQTAQTGQLVMELVPLFSQGGHHHIPILDDRQRLMGIVTQTDLVRALAGALQVPQA